MLPELITKDITTGEIRPTDDFAALLHVVFGVFDSYDLLAAHAHMQEHFVRGGVERWNLPSIRLKHDPMPLLRKCGFVNRTLPRTKQVPFPGTLVLGAVKSRVEKRLKDMFLLWEEGYDLGVIYLLGCERELKEVEVEDDPDLELGMSEAQMMVTLFDRMVPFVENSERLKNSVVLVTAPSGPDGKRSDTAGTVRHWEKDYVGVGVYLSISNQPYCHAQSLQIRKVMKDHPHAFVDTVGTAAPGGLSHELYAREVAGALYRALQYHNILK